MSLSVTSLSADTGWTYCSTSSPSSSSTRGQRRRCHEICARSRRRTSRCRRGPCGSSGPRDAGVSYRSSPPGGKWARWDDAKSETSPAKDDANGLNVGKQAELQSSVQLKTGGTAGATKLGGQFKIRHWYTARYFQYTHPVPIHGQDSKETYRP